MERLRWRRSIFNAMLSVAVALCASVSAAWASPHTYDTDATVNAWAVVDDTRSIVHSTSPLVLEVTIEEIRPDYIVMRTDVGRAQVPPRLATFSKGAAPVAYGNLHPTEAVTVTIPPFSAELSLAHWGVLEMLQRHGTIILPSSLFSKSVLSGTRVFFGLPTQRFIRTSLWSALSLQKSQGGMILSQLPNGALMAKENEQASDTPRIGTEASLVYPPVAPADDTISTNINIPPVYLHTCRVVRIGTDDVELLTHGTVVRLPSALATFTSTDQGFYPLAFTDLDRARTLFVHVFGFSGRLLQLDSKMMTVQTADGTVRIPVGVLPKEYRARTLVAVRRSDGQVEHVPLNTAIDLLRLNGANLVVPLRG